jgi:predicted metalloprotease
MQTLATSLRNAARLFAVVAAVAAAALGATASADARQTNIVDPDDLVNVVIPQLNRFWGGTLAKHKLSYARPRAIYWYSRPGSHNGCAMVMHNASYCSTTKSIYLDKVWLAQLTGEQYVDFAAATILAHEWGHWIQEQLGWLKYARDNRYYVGKELQADCFAGMFASYAERIGLLEEGDLDEAAELMVSIGDEPGTARDAENAHGGPDERLEAFARGYESESLVTCNAIYRELYG